MGLFGKKKTESTGIMGHGAAAGASTVRDPVCGMDIEPKTAAGKSEYMGKTYYFCSLGCKKSFDANPVKYTSGQPVSGG